MRQMKNRLLLFNFSTHELILNTICLFISFFFLSDFQLHSLIAVNLIFIFSSGFVLNWSIKNKIYDSDILMQCRPRLTVFSTFLYTIYVVIKIVWFYCVLNLPTYLFSRVNQETTSIENTLIIGVVLIPFSLGSILYLLSATKNKISDTYIKERRDLISDFKLDKSNTFFCMDNNKISGFISSGKMYAVSHGLIHEDIIIDYNEIVSYLKETGLSFSDLDGGHIEVIKMYSI